VFSKLDYYYKLKFLKKKNPLTYSPPQHWLVDQVFERQMVSRKFEGSIEVEGAGGAILDPRGNQVLKYAWSLGHATKNQPKEYVLLKGV
jgi:hypothetical protein